MQKTETWRIADLALGLAGLAGALWLAMPAAIDAAGRTALASTEAQALATRACAQAPGCRKAGLSGGFDWKRGERRVLLALTLDAGASPEPVRTALTRESGASGFFLRWALGAEIAPTIERVSAKGRRS